MSNLSVDDLLAQATCAVLIEGETIGTAWLVSDEGHLLTAGHLLCKESEESKPCDEVYDEIEVQFSDGVTRAAHKVQSDFQQEKAIDFAVLKLKLDEMPQGREPLPVSLADSMKGRFKLYGYGESLPELTGGDGTFVSSYGSDNKRYFRLKSKELAEEGFSGGAVYSEQLGAVVAIQVEAGRSRIGAARDTVLAMPLYRIAEYWEPLASLVPPDQPEPPKPLAKPFYLLMIPDHNVLVAEGMYSRYFALPRRFASRIDRLIDDSRDILANSRRLRYTAEDLERDFVTHWTEVWLDYLREVKNNEQVPQLILKVEDREDYLDFPIELARHNREYLALNVPIYKEVMGIGRERTYHLSEGCFSEDDSINVMIVGSNVSGSYRNEQYRPLNRIRDEIEHIYTILQASPSLPPINEIIVLTNEQHLTLNGRVKVRVENATKSRFEQETKENQIHLLHFSGHYVFNESLPGLLFPADNGKIDLLNLAKLRDCLQNSPLRLVYLNGCSSGQNNRGDYMGATYTCLKAGAFVTIGMRWPIRDSEGVEMSRYFYEELAKDGRPEMALWRARVRAHIDDPSGTLWAAPIMLTR